MRAKAGILNILKKIGALGLTAISDEGFSVCDAEAEYRPRNPEENPLYGVVAEHLETFLAKQQERDRPVPRFVERELRSFLECGVSANGFLHVHCDACGKDRVVPFSCKGEGRSVPHAAAAGWRIRQRILWTGCSQRFQSANGCFRCLFPKCALFRLSSGSGSRIPSARTSLTYNTGWWFPECEPKLPELFGVFESNANIPCPDDPEFCSPEIGSWPHSALMCRIEKENPD
jgi:hypothetical protein